MKFKFIGEIDMTKEERAKNGLRIFKMQKI